MASDEERWWRQVPDLSAEQALAVEAAEGHQQRFVALDALTARLLSAALDGRPVATIACGSGPSQPDTVEVTGLSEREKAATAEVFGVREQQQRGAWYLPQKLSLKAGVVNLPHLLRHRSAHAITLAGDDTARVVLTDGADAVHLWAVLIPLFDALMEPVRVRATGSDGSAEEQQQLWNSIEKRYLGLGIAPGALEMFRFGGGWHRLDRAGQQQARVRLLEGIAAADPGQLVARFRMTQLQALMAAFAKKAKNGTVLARRVLTRTLQPAVSGYFAGDWLAALDYLQAVPHPDEEVITALPQPRLFVGLSAQAASMAAEQGIPEEEAHAMLAAFLGGPTSQSPVEERVAALRNWWTAFDRLHAVQAPGMRPLWGLVNDGMDVPGSNDGLYTPQLYREALPPDVTDQVDRLWDGVTLKRYPGSIVSNPRPHQEMASAFGPAIDFWHGVALTAWFVCEGPYSRTPLSEAADYYSRPLAALTAAGTPVEPALFEELRRAERRLGPEKSLTDPTTYRTSVRRKGFERLRDIITRHRRAWAKAHLEGYLRHRWRSELEDIAHAQHRVVAAKGRPPTLTQFAQFAAPAANHWTGGDLGALYTAIGEPAPAQQQRPDRLLPRDGFDFAQRLYQALGGLPVDDDMRHNDPEESRRHWFLGRLATEGLRYLQLQEALGEPPTAKQFGSQRLTWPWSGEETEGWPILQHTIASLTQTAASASATGPADGGDPLVGQDDSTAPRALAKGANAALQPGHVAVRITTAGAPVDVSAVLLNSNGKVRDDNDLVFYNHPHHDGIHANGDTITADLGHIPTDVHTIAVIVSIDLQAEPTATFDRRTTWQADISQPNTRLRFRPDPFTSGETVIIAAEIYRRASDWKIRAVAQGYDTGLAGLATDYGINVEA